MAAGDLLELRVYQMVLSGVTPGVALYMAYAGPQPADELINVSIPIRNELTGSTALRFSLKQTLGNGRAFPYKVLRWA